MAIQGPTTDPILIRSWSESHSLLPAELLPNRLDHEPALLKLIHSSRFQPGEPFIRLSWEEFFSRIDQLGLAVVFADDSTGYHELVQIEERSPYRNPSHYPAAPEN